MSEFLLNIVKMHMWHTLLVDNIGYQIQSSSKCETFRVEWTCIHTHTLVILYCNDSNENFNLISSNIILFNNDDYEIASEMYISCFLPLKFICGCCWYSICPICRNRSNDPHVMRMFLISLFYSNIKDMYIFSAISNVSN